MALLPLDQYLALMIASGLLFLVYTGLVFVLIVAKCKQFDRFTQSLTVFGMLGSMLFTGSTTTAFIFADEPLTKQKWSQLYLTSQLGWYSSLFMSICFMIFAFKLYAQA
jgi:hypothetical protein